MVTLAVILSRAGSKGLPDKCVRPLLKKPVIEYTFEHAKASSALTSMVLTTDSEPAKALARKAGIEIVDRPAELATDTATVDAAARHAVEVWERRHQSRVDAIVLLYGNIPVRAEGLIDRALERLACTGADSVRSVALVTKQHPDWVHRLEGDRMVQYRPNSIYRRQDLQPVYYHDGAVVAVLRSALFGALLTPDDHQAFLGLDRRALVQRTDQSVDIDEPIDLHVAEALLRAAKEDTCDAAGPASGSACGPAGSLILGGRQVGRGQRVLIIAEAGVNHDGKVDDALQLIDAAAAAGVDAVKFQIFRAKELVTGNAPKARYQENPGGAETQREMLSRLELSDSDFSRLKRRCDQRSVLFLATPFSERDLDRLCALDVSAIKIASTDLTNPLLLARAAAAGRALILSTGASTAEEIHGAVEQITRLQARDRLILLHCVSSYPTPVAALNLRALTLLERTFGVPCGLSDHSTSTQTGAWAVAAGACILEKHFTLDPKRAGPDHAMSLSPEQLADYVLGARSAEAALGTGVLGLTELESDVRRTAGRSVVAAVDIPRGSCLTQELLAVKRPAGGIPPKDIGLLLGRRVRHTIPCDTALIWEMLH